MSLVTQKVINEMDYHDFERIVEAVYGQSYELVADVEASNYQAKTFDNITKDAPRYRSNASAEIEKFKNTGHYFYLAATLLRDLVDNDYLPEGDYVINISW